MPCHSCGNHEHDHDKKETEEAVCDKCGQPCSECQCGDSCCQSGTCQ